MVATSAAAAPGSHPSGLHVLSLRVRVELRPDDHLQRLPVDQLKIDRSFVVNMATNEKDAFIVRSTVTLGRDLGLKIVAEGVEDELTAGLLERLGCDLIQGSCVSKPLSAQELMDWLAAQSRAAAPSVGAVPHDGEVATTPPAAAARAGTPGTENEAEAA